MGEDVLQWLAGDNGLAVHAGVFLLLLLGAFGFPIPEDIPLILAGVALSKDIVSVETMFATCVSGVLLADTILFSVGYYFGEKIIDAGTRSPFFPAITEGRIRKLRVALRKNRLLYILIARHLFPIRSATFITAGALRIPVLEFIAADGLASLLSVTIMLSLGFFLGERLTPEVISILVREGSTYIALILLVLVIIWFVHRHYKKASRLKKTPSE